MNVNLRINLPLHACQFVGLLLLFAVFAASVADAQEVTIVSGDQIDRIESVATVESGGSFEGRARQFKQRIKERLVRSGASDGEAESIAESITGAIQSDLKNGIPDGSNFDNRKHCDDYTCEKKKQGWFWRRNSDPQRWYPGKVLGEAAGDVYWTAKVTLFLTIACPFVIVAFFIFGIAWLIFRPRK